MTAQKPPLSLDHAAQLLTARGVKYRRLETTPVAGIEGPALEILSGSAPGDLGHQAKRLREAEGFRTIYSSSLFEARPNTRAAVNEHSKVLLVSKGALQQASWDDAVLHELHHIFHISRCARGLPSLFRVDAVAVDGRERLTEDGPYPSHISFDEISTYTHGAAVIAARMRKSIEAPDSWRQRGRVKSFARQRALLGAQVSLACDCSKQVMELSAIALELLKAGVRIQMDPREAGENPLMPRRGSIEMDGRLFFFHLAGEEADRLVEAAGQGDRDAFVQVKGMLANNLREVHRVATRNAEVMEKAHRLLRARKPGLAWGKQARHAAWVEEAIALVRKERRALIADVHHHEATAPA